MPATSELVVGSPRVVLRCGGSDAAWLERSNAASPPRLTVPGPGGKLTVRGPLLLPGGPGGAPTDALGQARAARSLPVAGGAVGAGFEFGVVPLGKLAGAELLPVPLGGTGMDARPGPPGWALAGAGVDPLRPVPFAVGQDGSVGVAGGLRLEGGGAGAASWVTLASGRDALGRQTLLMSRPDGEAVDIVSPRQSLRPSVRSAERVGPRTLRVAFRARRASAIAVASLADDPGVPATPHRVLEGYMARWFHRQAVTTAAPETPAGTPGYPFRSERTVDVVAPGDLPPGPLAVVVADEWGGVSPVAAA